MTTERQKLIERIQKLLALSKSENQHEAELATQRASELMEKYQIDMAEAALSEAQSEQVEHEYYDVPGLKMKYVWVVRLAWAAAKLYDAEVLMPRTLHKTTIHWIGYKSDIEMAKTTFEHLYRSWITFVERDLLAEKRRFAEFSGSWKPRDTMKFKQGHGQGYAISLLSRAEQLAKERKNHVKASGSTGTALVVVKDTAVMDEVNRRKGKRNGKETTGSGAGYHAGRQAGNTVALGGNLQKQSRKQIGG